MPRRTITVLVAAAFAAFGGCIASDELTTLTIRPDGSAELVKLQSNIRSTEPGAKGAQELRQFVEEFDAHQDEDYRRITEVGGKVLEARWLRREEPYAKLLTASFPGASALEGYWTLKGDKGEVIAQSRFTQGGNRRKLSVVITPPKDQKFGEPEKPNRQAQADGISETRIVVAGGRIIGSRGFTVAADRRSALLEPSEILAMLQRDRERVELFLEWELGEN
jgi:hypothetical protein